MFWIQRMLAGIRARGEPCDAVLTAARIPAALIEDSDARVTGEQYADLFRLLMERRADEGLGFLSRKLKPGSFGLMTRFALHARTLEQAIEHSGKVLRLIQDDFALEQTRTGAIAGIQLVFSNADANSQSFLHDMLLRVLWQFFVWLVGSRLKAVRFDFGYPVPERRERYAYVFPEPTCFNCPYTAAWFKATWLTAPVRRDAAALRAYLKNAQRNVILPPRSNEQVSARVRSLLRPGWTDLASAANLLHMSTATLQRHLAAENTSFRALKDALRRDLAITELLSDTQPLDALAQELGFADTPSFQRAFKRWTGRTPAAYRSNPQRLEISPRSGGQP